jgi:hypothetical protein
MATMLNKDGNTDEEDVYNERPPPYNPDFLSYGQQHTDHASPCRFESPSNYNPDLVEHVVWDEQHLAPGEEEMRGTQRRNEHFEYPDEMQEQL